MYNRTLSGIICFHNANESVFKPIRIFQSKLLLLPYTSPALLHELGNSPRFGLMRYNIRATEELEAFMKTPLHRFLNRLVEDKRKERYSSQTKLMLRQLHHQTYPPGKTYAYWSIRPYRHILRVLQIPPGIPYDTMYRKSRQAHTRNALEYRPLYHDTSEVLNCRHVPSYKLPICCRQWFSRIRSSR